jgi:septal ring factor EnvC (AmiA/AmiB activator)
MKAIKKNSSIYEAQIKQKKQEADRIDAEIDRIIREAIVKSNKKSGATTTKSSSGFSLTPEEKILAANFVANKGELPWPVSKGFVTLGYGTKPHPLDNSLTIKSNGFRISTEKGAKVQAVFNGEVIAVVRMKNVNPIVMVRHGDYLTVYKNLSAVYVKEGDQVKTKQVIGEVFTNASNGETILSFSISKGTATENPASWVFRI